LPKIPGVNHLDAVRALEKAGFRIVRQGKHIVMSKWSAHRDHSSPQSRQRVHHGRYRA
jgi:predicted RNA binding protein YcfA (HicA-like mRNA interferase family)